MNKSQGILLSSIGILSVAGIVYFSHQHKNEMSSDADKPTADAHSSRHHSSRPSRVSSAHSSRSNNQLAVQLDEDFKPSLYKKVSASRGSSNDSNRAQAYVRIPSSSTRVVLTPNQIGAFPIQSAALEETVAVRLELSEAKPGTPVSVVILDGGSFPEELGVSRLLTVEKWGGVNFQYTTSSNDGHHRVKVQPSGKSPQILDFYAS